MFSVIFNLLAYMQLVFSRLSVCSCGFFGALNWFTFNLHMQKIFLYWRHFGTKWMVFNWVYALHCECERYATVYGNEVHFKHWCNNENRGTHPALNNKQETCNEEIKQNKYQEHLIPSLCSFVCVYLCVCCVCLHKVEHETRC